MTFRNRVLFSFLVWASCGHACKWTDVYRHHRQTATNRHVTGTGSKWECRFEGHKVALRRH
jgi:hypothetical protein